MTPIQPSNILALIPAYNEESAVARIVSRVQKHLPVIVVDDGSQDATALQAETAGAIVLRQEPNQGKGAALQRGFRHALEQGYTAVLTLDADGQHDPAEIPKFLERFTHGRPDLIIGYRRFDEMPFLRRLANVLGAHIFSWATRTPIQDNQRAIGSFGGG